MLIKESLTFCLWSAGIILACWTVLNAFDISSHTTLSGSDFCRLCAIIEVRRATCSPQPSTGINPFCCRLILTTKQRRRLSGMKQICTKSSQDWSNCNRLPVPHVLQMVLGFWNEHCLTALRFCGTFSRSSQRFVTWWTTTNGRYRTCFEVTFLSGLTALCGSFAFTACLTS